MSEKIIIVDENDNEIALKDGNTIPKDDIYRVSALWITNSSGDILLAQRAFTKSHAPGKWGPAVVGTIEENETYEINIYKEAEEEIGLKNIIFKLGPKTRTFGDNNNHFTQWYFAIVDKLENEFVVDKNEVEQIKWFKKEELIEDVKTNPDKFVPSMRQRIEMFC